MWLQRGLFMNVFYDANAIYEAGTKAIAGSKFKQQTQLYRMTQLLETARLQRDLMEGAYEPQAGQKFLISERGKARYITSNTMRDKTLNHVLCDEVLGPTIAPFVIYDNDASQKGKGVKHHRQRIEVQLHDYFQTHGNNDGWILLVDFSGYYPNIRHDKCLEVMDGFLDKSGLQPDEILTAKQLLRKILKTFELDVSRFSDQEIAELYERKVDPMMNVGVDPRLLTGEKVLRKGVDIGSQPSQDIGIIYPYRIDNYAKIVKSVKGYGRYTDDFHAIHESRDFLQQLLDGFRSIAKEYGLIINEKKTRICRISEPFRILKVQYWLTDTGKVVRKIHPKSVTRERRKLKAYKRLLDDGRIDMETVENSFKSWLGGNWKLMSQEQIKNIYALYYALFQRRITWKKGHGRLLWLMGQPWKDSPSTATTTSAETLSQRQTSPENWSM